MSDVNWFGYFRENMEALHLSAPRSLFGNAKQAKDTISKIAGAIRAFGTKATLGEIIGTIPSLSASVDLLTLYSAVSASFYIGACIGSAAVATGRSISGGKQIADFFEVGRQTVADSHLLHDSYRQYHRAGGRLR